MVAVKRVINPPWQLTQAERHLMRERAKAAGVPVARADQMSDHALHARFSDSLHPSARDLRRAARPRWRQR